MLAPDKYTDFKVNIINIASSILSILIQNKACTYNEVLTTIKHKHGENSKYEFQNALNFLYLLGKIEYFPKTDALELIK